MTGSRIALRAPLGMTGLVIPSERSESRDLHLPPAAVRHTRRKDDTPHLRSNATLLPMRTFYVYILANRSRGLYIGVTNDMARRLAQHRVATTGYSATYRCARLVFVETAPDARTAIAREKQLKNWRREKKLALIQAINPAWDDLSADP